jgi:hypothetical protein
LRFGLAGALACAGCTSHEVTICERLAECDLLPDGFSQDKCEATAGSHVEDDRLSRCAECVSETDCSAIVDECGEHCEPIY